MSTNEDNPADRLAFHQRALTGNARAQPRKDLPPIPLMRRDGATKMTRPYKHYSVTAYPAEPVGFDVGLTFRIDVLARTPKHAQQRVRRYASGLIVAAATLCARLP
jgi:hypothetical protein